MTMLLLLLSLVQAQAPSAAEDLFDAARSGDRARVARLLDSGLDVNSKARYDATALMFAADKGRLDVVRLLVERGAAVNAEDTFYKFKAIDLALMNGHRAVATYLLERGSRGAPSALVTGIRAEDQPLVIAALAGPDMTPTALASAVGMAKKGKSTVIAELVAKAAADRPPTAARSAVTVPAATLQSYAGTYRSEEAGLTLTVSSGDNVITLQPQGAPQPLVMTATSETSFAAAEIPNLTATFNGRGGMIESLTIDQNGQRTVLTRATAAAAAPPAAPAAKPATPAAVDPTSAVARSKPSPWPAFRGANAGGVADGQGAVTTWDVASGRNVRWKTPIPGIAVSSPIVWGDRVYVTTAVGSKADTTFRTGLYGDVAPIEDLSTHTWKLFAVDRRTGTVAWQRDVITGEPKVKRHPKSSLASSTPATDGQYIVVVFGSIGVIACYDAAGKELWQRNIGIIDNGWFFDPTYQWGHSSSPVIYKSTAILQVDQQKGSYIAAFDLATGKTIWRTERADEISTWGTPTLLTSARGDELVTNGTKIRGYDPATGKQLWTLGPNSEVTVGTPIAGKDVIYVTGGYPPVRPIYAVKAGASGDISLPKGATSSPAIAWSNDREGTYIPTPLLYRDILYTLNSNGILIAYNAITGERLYRTRVGGGGAFAASPIAADGRLYFASEDGEVFVVAAGPEYVELGKHSMNEVIMATPAISDGLIIVRTLGHLYGLGETPAKPSAR
jgi:outer membrane protein assembly factor BamB